MLLDALFIERTIKKHFLPLFHANLMDSFLKYLYRKGIAVSINQNPIRPDIAQNTFLSRTFWVQSPGSKKKIGMGYIVKADKELSDGEYGVAVSVYGKVIKRGWEWLGLHPQQFKQIFGIIEIPALSEILTTNKTDFLTDSSSLKKYYRFRKVIQHALLPILEDFGEVRSRVEDPKRGIRALEREIEQALRSLVGEFPELTPLFGIKRGRAPLMSLQGIEQEPVITIEEKTPQARQTQSLFGEKKMLETGTEPKQAKKDKKQHRGLIIRFAQDRNEKYLGHMIENTVWINTSHPAYQKAQRRGYEEYHIMWSVAWVLSQFIQHETSPQEFFERFLYSWGAGVRDLLSF